MNCGTRGNYQASKNLSVKRNPIFVCSRLTIECLRSESRAENQERNERQDIKIRKHSECDSERMNRIIIVKLK